MAVGLALFLPETWTGDPDQMTGAGVPEDRRTARTKLEIAVREIDRVREGACASAACWLMRVMAAPPVPAGPERKRLEMGRWDFRAQQGLPGRHGDDLSHRGAWATAPASCAGSGLGCGRG